MESAPAAPSIIRLARLTASYLYTVSFSHSLYSKKLFNNRPTSICLSTTVCVWVYHDSSSLQSMLVTGGKDQYGERWGAMAIELWRISRPSGDALRWGDRVTMGLPPHTPLGDFIPKPHLRFAAVESGFRVPAVRQVSLRSLTAFSVSLRVGDDWAAAQTCLREFFPQTPISASRRLKAAFVCQPSVRFRFAP